MKFNEGKKFMHSGRLWSQAVHSLNNTGGKYYHSGKLRLSEPDKEQPFLCLGIKGLSRGGNTSPGAWSMSGITK